MTDTSESNNDPKPESATETPNEAPPGHVNTDCAKAPLNSKWSFKLWIITIFVLGFGVLGFYDATLKYPERGERFADWAKWQYLEAAKSAGNEEFGIFERQSSVGDPAGEFARLDEEKTRQRNFNDAQNQSSTRRLRATMYNTRYEWLKGLKTIGRLNAEHTTIGIPQEELDTLKAKWASGSSPKPLKGYDIPSQWAIVLVCGTIGLWMLFHIFRVIGQKFSWDASTMTITVPGPIRIAAADLQEVDKRKWDKFIVYLRLRETHPTHGGKEIKVDTYQHALVEDWILAMEDGLEESQESGR